MQFVEIDIEQMLEYHINDSPEKNGEDSPV